jgi:hypothetical protein
VLKLLGVKPEQEMKVAKEEGQAHMALKITNPCHTLVRGKKKRLSENLSGSTTFQRQFLQCSPIKSAIGRIAT